MTEDAVATPDAPSPEAADLLRRLDALEDAVALRRRHGMDIPEEVAGSWPDHARARLRHGTDHAVVALVGSTGSGKSSLLNAVVGEEVARVGITRPTTAVTQAVAIGEGADALLDLVGVTRRHQQAGDGLLEGLVLLDLPDFDSVALTHRMEVDRLITLVDLLVWVTDPQKYADESLHAGYLRRLADHADVMQVVLNKVDTVPADQLPDLIADLQRLLAADGLGELSPIPTSVVTPDGVDGLRGVLAAEISARQAALARIHNDLRHQADLLAGAGPDVSHPAGPAGDAGIEFPALVEGLARAAGVDRTAALVAAQYRRDAALRTGWPPLRWVRRLRRAPLAGLTPAAASGTATAEVSRTLRAAAGQAVTAAGPVWAEVADATVRGRAGPVAEALDTAVIRDVQVLRQPPRWWRAVAGLHRVLLLVALVGALWLGGLLAAQALLLLDPAALTPRVGTVPLPTLLLAGGLVAGLVVGLLSSWAARIGSRRQGRRAVASLHAAVAEVARDQVLEPARAVVADRDASAELLRRAAGYP